MEHACCSIIIRVYMYCTAMSGHVQSSWRKIGTDRRREDGFSCHVGENYGSKGERKEEFSCNYYIALIPLLLLVGCVFQLWSAAGGEHPSLCPQRAPLHTLHLAHQEIRGRSCTSPVGTCSWSVIEFQGAVGLIGGEPSCILILFRCGSCFHNDGRRGRKAGSSLQQEEEECKNSRGKASVNQHYLHILCIAFPCFRILFPSDR